MTHALNLLTLSFDAPMHLQISQDNRIKVHTSELELEKTEKASIVALSLISPSAEGELQIEFGVGTRSRWATYYSFLLKVKKDYSDDIAIFFSDGQPFIRKGGQLCSFLSRRDVIKDTGSENENPNLVANTSI